MTDEQKLYGLMATVREQQKVLDTALTDIQMASKALAQERAELANTVKSIAETVGESASESLLNAMGDAQRRFSDEMTKTTSQALKSAQDANQELKKAKETVTLFTNDLKGTLRSEIQHVAVRLTLAFSVLGILSFGGVYWYFLHKAEQEQSNASYWIEKGNDAFAKCQKLKNCRD